MHWFGRVAAASGLLASVVVLAPGARAAGDVVITEEARTHFAAGVALLQDPKAPRYEEAYREFKSAYAASPSYKILGNLGLCAMKIERDSEAIQAYETYLKDAGTDVTSEQRAQVQRDLLTLKAGVLEVTVSSDPPGASIVDYGRRSRGPTCETGTDPFSHRLPGPTARPPCHHGTPAGLPRPAVGVRHPPRAPRRPTPSR